MAYKFHLGEDEDEQALRAQLPVPPPLETLFSADAGHQEAADAITRMMKGNSDG